MNVEGGCEPPEELWCLRSRGLVACPVEAAPQTAPRARALRVTPQTALQLQNTIQRSLYAREGTERIEQTRSITFSGLPRRRKGRNGAPVVEGVVSDLGRSRPRHRIVAARLFTIRTRQLTADPLPLFYFPCSFPCRSSARLKSTRW
jgi:hypothetical protein